MKSTNALLSTALLCLQVSILGQATVPDEVIPIGQLEGPILRQMSGTPCGPFFMFAQTDARGGGFVNVALGQTPSDVTPVTVPVKAITVRWCDNCRTPRLKLEGNETTVRSELMISHAHWNVSPCLKAAKR